MAENSPAGTFVGTPVAATDADGDALTYSLSGSSRVHHRLGQRSDHGGLWRDADYETTSSYSVTVTVSDGKDDTDNIAVNIDVTDVDEPARQAGRADSDAVKHQSQYRFGYQLDSAGPMAVVRRSAITMCSTASRVRRRGPRIPLLALARKRRSAPCRLRRLMRWWCRRATPRARGDWSDEGMGDTNRSPTFTDAVDFQRYRQGTAINAVGLSRSNRWRWFADLRADATCWAGVHPHRPMGKAMAVLWMATPTEPKGKTRYDLSVTDEDGDEATASFFVVVTENLLPAFGDAVDDKIMDKG